MIKKRFIGIVAILLIFNSLISCSLADSLWKKDTPSPYSSSKTYKEGDIVTILILESSSALSQAGTNTGVMDDLSFRFTNTLQNIYSSGGPSGMAGVKGENKYRGTGSTTRTSNIQAKVSAVVTKVFTNGNLAVLGRHRVEVNREKQEISITGIIRSKDISQANTIYSFQVAESNIIVKGEGAIADAENPGWLTRIIDWLF
jgi:flagellar L-ring protein precursor FlgH